MTNEGFRMRTEQFWIIPTTVYRPIWQQLSYIHGISEWSDNMLYNL